MSLERKFIPSSAQTVGPYFRIGLTNLIDRAPITAADGITIHGEVFDCNRVPVSDAMLEFWSPIRGEVLPAPTYPRGFRRAATDGDGAFSVSLPRPQPLEMEGGLMQAPHLLVLVFARGLLRHLITRVYFDYEAANASDPVLLSVPAGRRTTLIARGDRPDSFRWDVILQGPDETVFFAW